MSKKRMIMIAVAGLVSFGGSFVFAWLTKTAPQGQTDEFNQPAFVSQETDMKLPLPEAITMSTVGVGSSEMKKAMTEKQLKSLVYEVREKMREYNGKLQGLEVQEQRLQITHDLIKKDIEELNNLRIELASTVAGLKSERDKLLKSRVEIAQAEKANLVSIAATYDKMDAASASKILTAMCASQMQNDGFGSAGSSLDDAVKILHYMTERTKAKLLAELVASDPKLAAVLCQRLKQVVEGE